MEVNSNDSENEMVNRRDYLGAVGAGSVFTIQPWNLRLSSTGDDVKIPKLVNRHGVQETKTVPRSWYENLQHVKWVQSRLEDRYRETDGVASIGRVRREDTTFGGKHGLKIRIERSKAQLDEELPTEVDGIPIEVTDAPEGQLGSCEGFTRDFSEVPGGVQCEDGDEGEWGTTFVPVSIDGESGRYLMAAGHVFDICAWFDGPEGTPLEQSGDYFGDGTSIHNQGLDYGLFEPVSSSEIPSTSRIKDENGTYKVYAWYGDSAIDDLVSQGKSAYQMGTTTGQTNGTVTGNGLNSGEGCPDLNGEGVEVENKNNNNVAGQGDSGGPVYKYHTDQTGDKVNVIAMFSWYYDANSTPNKYCNGGTRSVGPRVRGASFEAMYAADNVVFY